MTVRRSFGVLACLLGLAVLAGTHLSVLGQDKGKEEKLVWKGFEPKSVFYQTLTTKTTQNMTVMQQEITQTQEQTFYIKWTGEEKTKEGNWVVTQSIEGVDMKIEIGGNTITYKSSDEGKAQNPMTDFFNALKTLKLKLTIDPAKMEVTNIEGQEEFVKKLGGTNPQMEPLLKSILSKDALKQMAEPTWGAFPTKAVKVGDTWEKTSKLNLGPIGSYETTFKYTLKKSDGKLDTIDVTANLNYTKPSDTKNGLPFAIKDATLKSTKGEGTATFDREAGYFKSSKLEMKLEGKLTIEVGGMETVVELKQDQTATVESSKDAPAGLKKAATPAKEKEKEKQ